MRMKALRLGLEVVKQDDLLCLTTTGEVFLFHHAATLGFVFSLACGI
jgi:hypothetical protein